MVESVAPVTGMTISVRSRRDVVIVDPTKFLAAARQAVRDFRPEMSEAEAVEAIVDVYDAVHALLDRDGQLAGEQIGEVIEIGHGAARPGVRVHDRSDVISTAGWLQHVVIGEATALQDYGCFLPEDPYALPVPSEAD
jgi:hypothetical protein